MTHKKQDGLTEKKSSVSEKGVDKDKKADDKTLQTTDPQEDMQGPISSIMQTIKEEGEAADVVTKEEADRKKDENT
jgi:hypothetical protein